MKVLLRQVSVVRDPSRLDAKGQPRCRGFAFIEFEHHPHALAALRMVNNNPAFSSTYLRTHSGIALPVGGGAVARSLARICCACGAWCSSESFGVVVTIPWSSLVLDWCTTTNVVRPGMAQRGERLHVQFALENHKVLKDRQRQKELMLERQADPLAHGHGIESAHLSKRDGLELFGGDAKVSERRPPPVALHEACPFSVFCVDGKAHSRTKLKRKMVLHVFFFLLFFFSFFLFWISAYMLHRRLP